MKRDLAASRKHLLQVNEKHQLSSDRGFPLSPHLLVDNSDLTRTEAAELIVKHFGLPRAVMSPSLDG